MKEDRGERGVRGKQAGRTPGSALRLDRPVVTDDAFETLNVDQGIENSEPWRELLPERYAPLSLIASGGMGRVYLAIDRVLKRRVAIKVLRESNDSSSNPERRSRIEKRRARFRREAEVLAALDHPNIVPVYDFGENAESLYLVMAYVSGPTLKSFRAKSDGERHAACLIAARICDAIGYVHRHGIVHRDVKPSNVIMADRLEPRVTDFGLAKLFGGRESDTPLTGTHEILGTPQFMAPEQITSARDGDARLDTFGIAATLYYMLTGLPPFPGQTLMDALLAGATPEVVPASNLDPRICPKLSQLLCEGLRADREHRIQSAEELGARLRRLLESESGRGQKQGGALSYLGGLFGLKRGGSK